jgi:hypothetical protein
MKHMGFGRETSLIWNPSSKVLATVLVEKSAVTYSAQECGTSYTRVIFVIRV